MTNPHVFRSLSDHEAWQSAQDIVRSYGRAGAPYCMVLFIPVGPNSFHINTSGLPLIEADHMAAKNWVLTHVEAGQFGAERLAEGWELFFLVP